LKRIWYLSDIDKDGQLDLPEFMVAMHLSEVKFSFFLYFFCNLFFSWN